MVMNDIQIQMSDELIKEIGNAIAAYGIILRAASLGMEVPKQFDKFKDLSREDLHHRIKILKDFHNELMRE
jgi:hypothetical protein